MKTEAKTHAEYLWIRRWGFFSGSYPGYIESQQIKAFEAKAPIDSIYCDPAGHWFTVQDVTNAETRRILKNTYPDDCPDWK